MKQTLCEKSASGWFLKLFVLFAMFFPVVTSESQPNYSPDFVLVNVFAALYILTVLWEKGTFRRLQAPVVMGILLLLLCYNVQAIYINHFHHHWYESQINLTISVLFFVALFVSEKKEEKEGILRFFLMITVVSTIVGFVPYLLGYYGVRELYPNFQMGYKYEGAQDICYSWFYLHKSEYALTLIFQMSLIVTYRNRFPRKWMYWGSLAVMMIGLVICNTRASMAASLFIFVGLLADVIRKQPAKIRKRYLLALIPIGLAMVCILYYTAKTRDLRSLGSRTYIWKAALNQVYSYPLGFGRETGLFGFTVEGIGFEVWNCHNVFLNILWQLSIPAGLVFLMIFVGIFLLSLWKNRNLQTVGIWIALLIPMNMDWCLLLSQWSLAFFVLYFLFFYPGRLDKAKQTAE